MPVARADEIDREVYNGTKTVTAEENNLDEYQDAMARADQAD